jgi:hypothetical protein
MIVLLLVVATILTFGLVASSMASISRVTATDTMSRGRWGVIDWDFRRNRRLDAHERRWQTSLISGRDQATRWPDFVAEVAALERAADLPVDPDPPTSFDADWIAAQLARLESHDPTPDRIDDHHDD